MNFLKRRTQSHSAIVKYTCWVLIILAVVYRLAHITGPIDNPNDWRQAETAYMTWRMSQESPPEFFASKVPYRGANDVHLAEMPFQPLITSYVYKVMGRESLTAARLVTLTMFAVSALYLFLIVRMVWGAGAAWLVMVIYCWSPLGLFYSRAVHVDFSIIAASHAFLYYGQRFYRDAYWRHYLFSIIAATIAFAMKAPYCFYLGLPLAAYAFFIARQKNIKVWLTLGAVFVLPFTVAWWFNDYRVATEAGFMESLLYPMKWTPELNQQQFFGTVRERLDVSRWMIVLRRLWYDVLTPPGVVLALLSCVLLCWRSSWRMGIYIISWLAGLVIYTLLVFRIIAGTHDYYSLVYVPFAAVLMGVGIFEYSRISSRKILIWGVVALGCLFTTAGVYRLETVYFKIDEQRLAAGQLIRQQTSDDALILSVTLGRSTGWSDPRILYYAKRRGWAIPFESLGSDELRLYLQGGADIAALLITPQRMEEYPPTDHPLAEYPVTQKKLEDSTGATIGSLLLFNLRPSDGQ